VAVSTRTERQHRTGQVAQHQIGNSPRSPATNVPRFIAMVCAVARRWVRAAACPPYSAVGGTPPGAPLSAYHESAKLGEGYFE
jgi:hypothetical protein